MAVARVAYVAPFSCVVFSASPESTSTTAMLVKAVRSRKAILGSRAWLGLDVLVCHAHAMALGSIEIVHRLAEVEVPIRHVQRGSDGGSSFSRADCHVGGVAVAVLERDLETAVGKREHLGRHVRRHQVVVLGQDDCVARDTERSREHDLVPLREVALLVHVGLQDLDAPFAAFADGSGAGARGCSAPADRSGLAYRRPSAPRRSCTRT